VSTLRQDLATRAWTIIARERAKRPHDFARSEAEQKPRKSHDETCPFCRGNEHMTPGTVFSLPSREAGHDQGWVVRVVPNKFAALATPEAGSDTGRRKKGIYLEMCGCGAHEVVIEVPDHSKTIATMSEEEVTRIVQTYRARFLELDRSS
jgi:UDPglucose--hexose-1-phosphate uridylyltransferase